MECFERDIGVAKLRYAATRLVEPRMPPPQPDQLLMKPVDRPTELRQIRRRRRKCRADRIVSPGPLLLNSPKRLLVAGIDRRQAAASHQDDQRMGKVSFIPQLAGDPRDVVIA